MKNLYTTITGILGAIAIALIPVIEGNGFDWKMIGVAVVLAALGVLAKDFNTTRNGTFSTKEKLPQ